MAQGLGDAASWMAMRCSWSGLDGLRIEVDGLPDTVPGVGGEVGAGLGARHGMVQGLGDPLFGLRDGVEQGESARQEGRDGGAEHRSGSNEVAFAAIAAPLGEARAVVEEIDGVVIDAPTRDEDVGGPPVREASAGLFHRR